MRIAVHEVCHGIIAVLNGYILHEVRTDGPANNPGVTHRVVPHGQDPESPEWTRKSIAVFCAGYIGEEVIYGWNVEGYVAGADDLSDRWMVRQAAVEHLRIQADIDAINAAIYPPTGGPVPRRLWKDMLPALAWAQYQALIGTVENEVRGQLGQRTVAIRHLARILDRDGVIDGPLFIAEMA